MKRNSEQNLSAQHFHPSWDQDFLNASGRVPYRMTNDYLFRAVLQSSNKALKGLICALLHLSETGMGATIVRPFLCKIRLSNLCLSGFHISVSAKDTPKPQTNHDPKHAQDKHHHSRARPLSTAKQPGKYPFPIRRCHNRFTDFIHHKSAHRQTDGNGKKLQRISA